MFLEPITDAACDFPDEARLGSFSRASAFTIRTDGEGVLLRLARIGREKRMVELHLHHHLLADILTEVARILPQQPLADEQRNALAEAAAALHEAIGSLPAGEPAEARPEPSA
jgi:hypothetical protein